jgi:hypothetical protein
MVAKVSRALPFQAICRAAVLFAATFGLTATVVAQSAPPADPNQGADPATQNSAPADAPAAPPSNVVSDAQVEANVLSALAGASSLADQPISTTTTYGVVTLNGTVKDDASKKLAAQLASTSPGVKKVVDSLEIGDVGAAAAAATPEGAAPLPNNAPPPDQSAQQDQTTQPDQNAQGAPQEQTYPPQQANEPQGQHQAPQGMPRRNCPPLYTPDGRPYPPPPGCESAAAGESQYPGQQPYQGQYPGQVGGKQVTVAAGAPLQIRVSQGMDGKHSQVGTTFNGILMNDVMAGGAIALPRGSEVQGTVVDAKAAGGLTGSGALALQLTGISIGGQQYPLESAVWGVNGPSKTGQTVNNTIGLGLLGAVIGGVAGGGPGAAVGAVAGGTAGLATSAATSGPQAFVPAESLLNFRLAQPTTVTTVPQAELNRLAMAAPGPRGYPQPGYYRRGYYRPYYYPYPY